MWVYVPALFSDVLGKMFDELFSLLRSLSYGYDRVNPRLVWWSTCAICSCYMLRARERATYLPINPSRHKWKFPPVNLQPRTGSGKPAGVKLGRETK